MADKFKSPIFLILVLGQTILFQTGCDIETSAAINEEIAELEMEINHLKRQRAELQNIHLEIEQLKARLAKTTEEVNNFKKANPDVLEYIRDNPPQD